MDGRVSWVLEVAVNPGQIETFRALMSEMVASTRNEPGALIYEWFIGDKGDTVHLYERYADSAAAITHLTTFGEQFAERFLAAATPTRFTVMGNPSPEATEVLNALGPTYLRPFGGFAK